MKFKNKIALLLGFCIVQISQSQVWFPEGVYTQVKPQIIEVDNQLISIGKLGTDLNNSFWVISLFDGKMWLKQPILTLNRTAEILDMCRYNGQIFVSGNFEIPNDTNNNVIRLVDGKWQGIGNFRRFGNLNASVSSIERHNGKLLIGGNFLSINGDTIPNLSAFNGKTHSDYFSCKDCAPNGQILDIESKDSILAISGAFSKINGQSSPYLYKIKNLIPDTFLNIPEPITKLAIDNEDIYCVGTGLKGFQLYKVNQFVSIIRSNIDSISHINNIVVWEKTPVINGTMNTKTSSNLQSRIMMYLLGEWVDVSNNFPNANFIAEGRRLLFATGESKTPISIWNPNHSVVRFYPGMTLVRARAFFDNNDNCILDNNEQPAVKQFIKLPFLNRGVFTTEKGLAEFMVPNNNNTYRFVVKPLKNIVRSNCADTSITKTFNKGNYFDSIQFPLKRIPNLNDIRVSISSPKGKAVLKNKRVVYYITYENMGSNVLNGKIYLKRNKGFSSDICLPLQKIENDSTLSWTYDNLAPGEQKTIYYSGLPSDSRFNQAYSFQASVYSDISNGTLANTEDDSDSIPQEVNQVLSAFRKDVYPSPDLGDSITYIGIFDNNLRYNISFNNFGTDTVFYAVIIDTLDLNLDMSYIQETGSNKSYYTEVQTDPNNDYKGILIWHFPNIRLAPNPSKDYENPNSGAYIGFKVVTKPLSEGYFLKNTASVFFDNTYAGSTNSVYVTLKLTGIHEVKWIKHPLQLYPNPVNDWVHIKADFKTGDTIEIRDAVGRLVYSNIIETDSEILFNCQNLSNGLYSIQVVSNNKIYQEKIMVQH
jgi:hypothetical protein